MGDLYTYSPGFEVTVLSSSNDYSGICLLGDEHFTLSLPMVRDAIRTAYFTVVELTSPVLSLKADDFRRLRELMQMMIHYQQMGLPLANDSLRMLYNLFLSDLSTVQQHSIREHRFPKRVEEIFLGFLALLPQHFEEHHDIGFYASELCITTTYLSRVVRQVSGGRTVVDYINQLLSGGIELVAHHGRAIAASAQTGKHLGNAVVGARGVERVSGIVTAEGGENFLEQRG